MEKEKWSCNWWTCWF